jgi:mRNA-degrading endonuclease RelE of RelBE toxin-antitoxin system
LTYQVQIERSAQKALARIAQPDQDRIIARDDGRLVVLVVQIGHRSSIYR